MSVLDPAQLKRWIEGERCASMLEMFEEQIVGPFYFGDKFTFVDFFACQVVTLLDARVLGPLETVSVALLDKSTKLREVSNRIAALPSAASIKAPVALGEYCLGADAVEEYRCAK
jgi:glutathione S-transferase